MTGVFNGKEYTMAYGDPSDYLQSFCAYRLGYVRSAVTFKFRGVSKSRTALAAAVITHD